MRRAYSPATAWLKLSSETKPLSEISLRDSRQSRPSTALSTAATETEPADQNSTETETRQRQNTEKDRDREGQSPEKDRDRETWKKQAPRGVKNPVLSTEFVLQEAVFLKVKVVKFCQVW